MCGIHGIISNSISKREILKRLAGMGKIQQHRGPDDKKEQVFSHNSRNIGLGFVRLSILDLETGMQPVICPIDNTAIICNGQIYNYIELKTELSGEPFSTKGDIEIGLHLYRKKGIDFLQDLNGMYAGAIYDPHNARVLLFRDRFGIKPLYYTVHEGQLIFSSEIKPILYGNGINAQLNESRLSTYFTYRYLPGEETMFKDIKRLPPGSFLDYNLHTGNFVVKRYWEYRMDKEVSEMSLEDAEEQFHALFTDAVRIRLRSDVEVGSLLSGGIDSSAVASQAALIKPNIRLFTMSFRENKYNELPQVEKFIQAKSDRFRTATHHTRLCSMEMLDQLPGIVTSVEEPISLGTILPTDQVCELAANQLKVVLTGEGADEIFAGYRKFLIEVAASRYHDLPREKQDELKRTFPELSPYLSIRHPDASKRYIQSECLFDTNELELLLGRQVPENLFPTDALPNLTGNEHPLNAAIAFESRARLPDYVILRLDKLSMRHSLETRTPFLDYRLAEFAATLPVNFKANIDENREKFICSHSFAIYDILDHQTAFRKKQPFTIPLANWLSAPSQLPDFLQEILLGGIIKQQGILDPDIVNAHVGNVSAGGIGPNTLVSEADRVFAIIIFSLWYNAFFEN